MPEELKKIELATSASPMNNKQKKSFPWKFVLIPVGVIVLLIAFLGILLLPLPGVISKGRDVMTQARATGAAIKIEDLTKTKEGLVATRASLTAFQKEYDRLKPASFVPFLGSYISDGQHAINAAFAGLSAGDKAIDALEPNADLLGLKGKSSFVSGTADDRIQTAVKTMSALIPKINGMAMDIKTLQTELDYINPDRYPESVGNTKVRSTIVGLKETIDNTANLFVNAQPLLTSLPSMLGEPTDKRYLIIFQNDKELRATGGFMTAYAQFRFVRGKSILEKADDIYALDAALKKTYPAPPEITYYLKQGYNLNIRDSNLSPDFKTSMQQFETMYANVSGAEHIDGIFAMDTHVLVNALKILGPIYVDGREYSADIDKRCNCAKAIYNLEDYSSRPVNYVRENRKGEIGQLLHLVLQEALGVSPSKYWGKLFQMLITEINEKHVLAYLHDPAAQKGVESFNMGGRIMTASESAAVLKYQEGQGWDYLHINDSNMGGAKSNMFVSEKITKDTTVNSDGTVTTKLTVDYNNPYPGSDCGLESGGLCLNAPLRDWVRIYVPSGSKLVSSLGTQTLDNKAATMTTYSSLSKTAFDGFLIVNPLGSARLMLTYTSPVKSSDGKYRLLIQKQPGTDGEQVILKVNGRSQAPFPLQMDTEVTL